MKFPLFAANMRDPDGKPLPASRIATSSHFGGVRIGLTGAAHDGTPRMSNPATCVSADRRGHAGAMRGAARATARTSWSR